MSENSEMDTGHSSGGADQIEVVDTMGIDDKLYVVVRDGRDGKHYRIEFRKNLVGQYKHDGGGGFRDRSRFSAAKDVAREYVETELGREVIPKNEWYRVKPETAAKIIRDSDEWTLQEISSNDERNGRDVDPETERSEEGDRDV